jgi:hypothetical protein
MSEKQTELILRLRLFERVILWCIRVIASISGAFFVLCFLIKLFTSEYEQLLMGAMRISAVVFSLSLLSLMLVFSPVNAYYAKQQYWIKTYSIGILLLWLVALLFPIGLIGYFALFDRNSGYWILALILGVFGRVEYERRGWYWFHLAWPLTFPPAEITLVQPKRTSGAANAS